MDENSIWRKVVLKFKTKLKSLCFMLDFSCWCDFSTYKALLKINIFRIAIMSILPNRNLGNCVNLTADFK